MRHIISSLSCLYRLPQKLRRRGSEFKTSTSTNDFRSRRLWSSFNFCYRQFQNDKPSFEETLTELPDLQPSLPSPSSPGWTTRADDGYELQVLEPDVFHRRPSSLKRVSARILGLVEDVRSPQPKGTHQYAPLMLDTVVTSESNITRELDTAHEADWGSVRTREWMLQDPDLVVDLIQHRLHEDMTASRVQRGLKKPRPCKLELVLSNFQSFGKNAPSPFECLRYRSTPSQTPVQISAGRMLSLSQYLSPHPQQEIIKQQGHILELNDTVSRELLSLQSGSLSSQRTTTSTGTAADSRPMISSLKWVSRTTCLLSNTPFSRYDNLPSPLVTTPTRTGSLASVWRPLTTGTVESASMFADERSRGKEFR